MLNSQALTQEPAADGSLTTTSLPRARLASCSVKSCEGSTKGTRGKKYRRDGRYSVKHLPLELQDAARRCNQQLCAAERRGIEWKLTFNEWWKIWQDSGHWAERGQGAQKYCMCRYGDVGPYAVGNVYIATNHENNSIPHRPDRKPYQWRVKRKVGLPQGVRPQAGKYYAARMIKGVSYHIGTFPTAELAHAAYLNFTVPKSCGAILSGSEAVCRSN